MLFFVSCIITIILFVVTLITGVIASAIPLTEYNYWNLIHYGCIATVFILWIIVYIYYAGRK